MPYIFSTLLYAVELVFSIGFALAVLALVQHRIKQLPLRKIPGPASTSWLTGNRRQMLHTAAGPFHEQLVKTYGNIVRITDLIGEIHLIISDTSACSAIFLKEQDTFEETPWFLETNRHVFGLSLFATKGAHHRKQRKMLNPVFSVKHMRTLVPLFRNITHQLRDVLHKKTENGPQEFDLLNWLGRLSLEYIAQGGLGYTFNGLRADDEENEFSRAMKDFTPTLHKLVLLRPLFPLISSVIPPNVLRFIAANLPLPSLHRMMTISDVMYESSKAVYEAKKALLEKGDQSFANQVGEGKDVITILLRANMSASEEDRLPEEELIAQMSTLLFAATDTTSGALSRIIQTLSEHPEAQDRLRQELQEAHAAAADAGLDWDELFALPYLEAVCRETLRVYPPVHFVQRMCRADISIPLSQPITTSDGPTSSLFVPRNTTLYMNLLAVNRSPAIWGPDATEWKPERWLAPLPESVAEARIPGVYSNTLTFIGGSHACIGFKFSQLEMKVALAELIPHFRFLPSTKDEVYWRFGGIVSPSVKGSKIVGPQMPMLVERI